MREKILLVGDSNTSKTLSLISLAILMPDRKVAVFDPDDGTNKVLAELGLSMSDIPNLTIYPVKVDYEQLMTNYKQVKDSFGEGDWCCFDMLGRFWDLCQQYYSLRVFGEDPLEHILNLKRQAQQVNFGGFDGLQDWTLIKRLHNERFMDDAVINSVFNVMATTSVGQYLPVEKVPKAGIKGVYASEFGIKPEGEKHNIYRFDTQAVLYRRTNKEEKRDQYFFRLVRDRGRPVNIMEEFEITGHSFYEVYKDYRQNQGIPVA